MPVPIYIDNVRLELILATKASGSDWFVSPDGNDSNPGTRYHLENLPSALDAPGEWFLSRDGVLRYLPRADELIPSPLGRHHIEEASFQKKTRTLASHELSTHQRQESGRAPWSNTDHTQGRAI
ncbi:hypothetical protein QEH52_07305 [Coraliomargarita sp. SDUM461003]|uniref:Uncharacterized protein n=1 Tax=Thalassobacterium maritimum TaxID=3041265 RepID=A0ABU1AVL5_9BACT|nr:hypothetical protein [Coraliomargarita sp. SDUM461003]MDQ8207309.1 hypothetical protein [Coraliomargarita sp. SDUM461003]